MLKFNCTTCLTSNADIRNVFRQANCATDFPTPVELNLLHLDFDNLNEISVNEATVTPNREKERADGLSAAGADIRLSAPAAVRYGAHQPA